MALRSSAVRLGEDFAGIYGPETIERFGLLPGGMLTEWASWRWVMYVNAALRGPALIGALLLVKPVITKRPKLAFRSSSWWARAGLSYLTTQYRTSRFLTVQSTTFKARSDPDDGEF